MATVAKGQSESVTEPAEKDQVGVLAEFAGPHELIEAAKSVREAGFSQFECYSPFPIHGIDDAMGTKPTVLPWFVIAAACVGCATAFGLQYFTNAYDYPYIISGKPMFSIPASIPVAFELSILFASFTALLGMLALNGLPKLYNALHRVDVFRGATTDKFFLGIETADPQFESAKISEFVAGLNPVSVVDYYDSTEPKQIPSMFYMVVLTLGILALVPPVIIAQMQTIPSNSPRIHPIQDMDFQQKLKTQRSSNAFADGQGMRPPILGTVSRGKLNEDTTLHRGLVMGAATDAIPDARLKPGVLGKDGKPLDLKQFPWVNEFPVEVNAALVNRGQQRFQIYCAPCHGTQGYGKGLVAQQAESLGRDGRALWVPPTSLHNEIVQKQPLGQIFNTITHGVRKMPAHGSQIPPKDRWAIVLYIKALQKSRSATEEDVPANLLGGLKKLDLPIPPVKKKKPKVEKPKEEKKKVESVVPKTTSPKITEKPAVTKPEGKKPETKKPVDKTPVKKTQTKPTVEENPKSSPEEKQKPPVEKPTEAKPAETKPTSGKTSKDKSP